jgi:hypothetical protein
MDIAAITRGCVQATTPPKYSAQYCGICVVLPTVE